MLSRAQEIKDKVQGLVDKTVTSVEEIHRTIAELPIKPIMETAGEQAKPYVESAKKIQDTVIGAVYGTIRKVNGQVGEIADQVLHTLGAKSCKVKEGQETKPSA